jgi:succinyl-diaminopimelate desuccinylase
VRIGPIEQARANHASVVRLPRRLVRIPSRAGIDPPEPVLAEVQAWLARNRLKPRILTNVDGPAALTCEIQGAHPGPRYVLDACGDTAPFGDEAAWTYPPTSGVIEDGWLHGRGSGDCKTAVAIFCHLAARIARQAQHLHGTLALLVDVDEHTGGFAGVKRYVAEAADGIAGVMIGYPGLNQVVVGGRGFWRADIVVHGTSGHTGRSPDHPPYGNAVEKAAHLAVALDRHRIPGPVDHALGLSPKLTVTAVHGGQGYSIVPDRCEISIDVRLTPSFDAWAAHNLVTRLVENLDRSHPTERATEIQCRESWPAYRLPEDTPVAVALLEAAARHLQSPPSAEVAGPSNIGNYLASIGVPATAGFGVGYQGLHGTDERIEVASIPVVQAIYHEAVLSLLGGPPPTASPLP